MDHASKQLLAWIEARLPALVGMDDTSDLATYLATFTTLPEVIEFLEPFAGNTRSMRQFAAEYVERKKAADVRWAGPERVGEVCGGQCVPLTRARAAAPVPLPCLRAEDGGYAEANGDQGRRRRRQ